MAETDPEDALRIAIDLIEEMEKEGEESQEKENANQPQNGHNDAQ